MLFHFSSLNSGQPSSSPYTGWYFSYLSESEGILSVLFPLSSKYPLQTFILSNPAKVSILVTANPVNPFLSVAYFNSTRFGHPKFLGFPVVLPNSSPFFLSSSCTSSFIFVIKGPVFAILDSYALKTPILSTILLPNLRPVPPYIPSTVVLDDVTFGYTPKI